MNTQMAYRGALNVITDVSITSPEMKDYCQYRDFSLRFISHFSNKPCVCVFVCLFMLVLSPAAISNHKKTVNIFECI